jgi:hypothetical protein
MESWWGWKYPFNSTCNTFVIVWFPRICCTLRSICHSKVYNIEEIEKTNCTLIRTIRTNYIPPKKCIRVVQISSWHSSLTKKVLRYESYINTLEKLKEVSLSMMFWILTTCLLTYPKIKSCKNTCYGSHAQNIMEMPNDVIRIVQRNVNSSVCQYNSSKPTNCKLYLKSQSKKHRCC